MNDAVRSIILSMLDITKLNRLCNISECCNSVDSAVFIYQYTTRRKIGIATLYLCRKHLHTANDIIKRIKRELPDKIIQSNIGKVAQPGRAHG